MECRSDFRDCVFFRELYDSAPTGILVVGPDDRIVYANRTYAHFVGCDDPRALTGRKSLSFARVDEIEMILDMRLRMMRGEVVRFQRRLVTLDGENVLVDVSGSILPETAQLARHFVLHMVDVTSQIATQYALEQVQREYKAAFEDAPHGVAILTAPPDGRFVRVNPAYLRMLRLTPEEVLGRRWDEVLIFRDKVDPNNPIQINMTNVPQAVRGRWFVRKDGSEVYLEGTHSAVFDEDGKPKFMIVLAIDATDRLRAEEALRASEEQVRQMQKMEVVGRLAGAVAHDFNNILAVILGHAGLIERRVEDTKLATNAAQIVDACERASALTRQLLAFTRRQIATPRIVDLGDEVLRLRPMLESLLGKQIDLRLETSRDCCVRVDPGYIDQVILNLALNARDAMPGGGPVSITVVAHGEEDVLLSVSDRGSGIAPEVLPRIFEPFFTTKAAGTGLGLSTVVGIIQKAGGHIDVETSPRGTTFRVQIPRAVEGPDEQETGRVERRGSQPATILVVDDEDGVRSFLVEFLADLGYRVLVAASGPEALDVVSKHGVPDLLITDVVMRGMSGQELAARIRNNTPRLRVLFVSGYADGVTFPANLSSGEVSFLQKPFSSNELARCIRDLLVRGVSVTA